MNHGRPETTIVVDGALLVLGTSGGLATASVVESLDVAIGTAGLLLGLGSETAMKGLPILHINAAAILVIKVVIVIAVANCRQISHGHLAATIGSSSGGR